MKRLLIWMLCILFLTSLLPTNAIAAPTAVAYDDGTIYVGGIYDMWAQITEGADRATYQWQVSIGADDYYGSGAWYDIDDLSGSYGYKGTKTSHLQIVGKPNDDSVAIGSGWENMKFRCKITLDGKDYYTNSLSELRHNTATLNAVIKAGNYKLYEPNVTGLTQQSGSGNSYTAKAVAGQELVFKIACKEVTDTRLIASEFECIPEIWITDGDTVVHADKELKYTPTRANRQFAVEFKLRMKIGVNNLGYTETKTMTVSTNLPSSIGSGTAKNRMLVYATPSTSAKRLATVPTGGTVSIVAQTNENWYKVAYNDHVGYVQAMDMEAVVTKAISEVRTFLPTPIVGKNPRFDATYATAGVLLYKTDPVTWYDETANRYLTAADIFQAGHQYNLKIWVQAAEGYYFKSNDNKPVVTGYVNNSVVSVYKAYEQDPKKVIELTWTYTPVETSHTCFLETVEQVDPDCIHAGQKTYYRCSSCGLCYSDAQGKNQINSTTWGILPATGHVLSEWRTTGAYHYKVCTVCGDFLEQEDHYGGMATCMTDGICAVCGFAYLPASEDYHNPDTSKWVGRSDWYHYHACMLCGAHCDIEDHRWSPTYLYQDKSGHAWICADCKNKSQIEPHKPGPAATESSPQTCKDCGYIIAPAKGHTHSLSKVPETAPTCTLDGCIAYYACTGCSDRFSDAEGKKPITDPASFVVPAIGHTASDVWGTDDDYHWQVCTVCNQVMDGTKALHDMADGKCATCAFGAEAPTESESTEVTTETTTETTEASTQPTQPTQSNHTQTNKRDEKGTPLWVLILIGVGAVGIGVGGGILLLHLMKKKR